MTPLCCESFNTNVPANFAEGPVWNPKKNVTSSMAGGIANARTQTKIPVALGFAALRPALPSELLISECRVSVLHPVALGFAVLGPALPSELLISECRVNGYTPRCSGPCCSGASSAVRAPNLRKRSSTGAGLRSWAKPVDRHPALPRCWAKPMDRHPCAAVTLAVFHS